MNQQGKLLSAQKAGERLRLGFFTVPPTQAGPGVWLRSSPADEVVHLSEQAKRKQGRGGGGGGGRGN